MSERNELRRAKLKKAALLRVRRTLQKAWDDIDYKIDVVEPALKDLELNASTRGLPEFTLKPEDE